MSAGGGLIESSLCSIIFFIHSVFPAQVLPDTIQVNGERKYIFKNLMKKIFKSTFIISQNTFMIKNTEDCVKHINKVQVEQKFQLILQQIRI